jgi:diphosphomevalonate decarboxylase
LILRTTAEARANVALVKYWGKRDEKLNLPAAGSLSLTLDSLRTRATVEWLDAGGPDEVVVAGAPAPTEASQRVTRFLDLVRGAAGLRRAARVRSASDFPVASGLASSASAFAALALAATRAAGLALPGAELSALARQGSGSAARSVFGGFVEMARGARDDGTDAVAWPLIDEGGWQVRVVVAIVDAGPKAVPSREGMRRTAQSSPYYRAWLEHHAEDLELGRAAVKARDLRALGIIAERNCLRMHAAAMGAGVLYFAPSTLEVIRRVQGLRERGAVAYFTIDAGPHVLVLCRPADAIRVERELRETPGVTQTIACAPGSGVTVVEEAPAPQPLP